VGSCQHFVRSDRRDPDPSTPLASLAVLSLQEGDEVEHMQ
jgi:hypothetical protein